MRRESTTAAYEWARQRYADVGVDTEAALRRLGEISISLPCWQGDDVGGFEVGDGKLGGGLAATGNYPGKARTAEELRRDAAKALSLIPGRHRFNLHAVYGEFGARGVERDEIGPEHFAGWIAWAQALGIGLDFNPTCFSHAQATDNFTLSHPDPAIRGFWIRHAAACRRIGAQMGQALGVPCVTNLWIPDGMKDTPVDRVGPRERLKASLDAVFADPLDAAWHRDAVEGKLFGIGCESYTVGSHEFYLAYAQARGILYTLDTGHFHPSETITDKISAILAFLPEIQVHLSRGVRWDSDHVVVLGDELEAIAQELVRGDFLARTHLALDYFDASINRVAAWVIGARSTLAALLKALLDPLDRLRECEAAADYTGRLALQEDSKTLPWGAVWDQYCAGADVPSGRHWLDEVRHYERTVMAPRRAAHAER